MKKTILTVLSFLLLSFAFAAGEKSSISIKLNLGECVFAARLLNTVNIRGAEVETYLKTKDFFISTVESNKKKKAKDVVNLQMPMEVAQGFVSFTQDAVISGGDAEFYQGIIKKIISAAK